VLASPAETSPERSGDALPGGEAGLEGSARMPEPLEADMTASEIAPSASTSPALSTITRTRRRRLARGVATSADGARAGPSAWTPSNALPTAAGNGGA
jgi:hypothetical protein